MSFIHPARRRASFLLVSLAAIVAGAPGNASATTLATCDITNRQLAVGIEDNSHVVLARSGSDIVITSNGETLDCGTGATITELNSVKIGGVSGGTVLDSFTLNLTGGVIGPGFTAEGDAVSEIEISVQAPFIGTVTVNGSDAVNETLKVTANGDISLNDDGDSDLTIPPGASVVELNGKGGTDTLEATGTPEGTLYLSGGAGADTLTFGENSLAVLDYKDATGAVTVDLAAGTASVADDAADTYSGIPVGVRGGSDGDFLTGDSLDNWIEPMGGADVVDGGDGEDFLSFLNQTCTAATIDLSDAAQSADCDGVVDQASNMEKVWGSLGNDTLIGDDGDNVLIDVVGINLFKGGLGDDQFDGGGFGSVVSYADASGPETISMAVATGADGNDGFNNIYEIVGSPFDDYFVNSSYANFDGGAGVDEIDLSNQDAGVEFDMVTGLMNAAGAAENFEDVIGSSFADQITTNAAVNHIAANEGNDVISFGATADGADVIDGGDGVDTADLSERTAALTVTLDETANDGESGEGKNLQNMENVLAGAGADSITGNVEPNLITGGGSTDTILGRGATDDLRGDAGVDTILGGSGDDRIDGGTGNDILKGDDGDDRIVGGDNDDNLTGGNGDDDLHGGLGNDTFVESAGASGSDLFSGGSGTDIVTYAARAGGVVVTIDGKADDGASGEYDNVSTDIERVYGGAGADRLTGSSAANYLKGNGGNDIINGGLGADTLVGDAGNDTFIESSTTSGADLFSGGSGIDVVSYGARAVAVTVTIDGNANDGASGELDKVATDVERVYGGAGADRLTGSGAANYLKGNGGNDIITGGLGADTMVGDAGDDRFYAKDGVRDVSISGGTGTDKARRDTSDPVSSIEGSF